MANDGVAEPARPLVAVCVEPLREAVDVERAESRLGILIEG